MGMCWLLSPRLMCWKPLFPSFFLDIFIYLFIYKVMLVVGVISSHSLSLSPTLPFQMPFTMRQVYYNSFSCITQKSKLCVYTHTHLICRESAEKILSVMAFTANTLVFVCVNLLFFEKIQFITRNMRIFSSSSLICYVLRNNTGSILAYETQHVRKLK